MPTYRQVQDYVKSKNGFVPKTCWIAHVLSDHGLTKREAHNRHSKGSRVHPCPPEKREAIVTALKTLGGFVK